MNLVFSAVSEALDILKTAIAAQMNKTISANIIAKEENKKKITMYDRTL